MDQQIRLGRFLIVNRILLFLGVYFLTRWESLVNFVLTFGKRWDGNSYTFIADHWYVTTGPERYFLVFPPFYPLLIKIGTIFTSNSVLSGMIISNIFFVAAMIIFYKLLTLDYDKKFALLTITLVSIFPTTFFFSVAYPESLFFFLFVSSFYLCRKKSYITAGVLGGLAMVTRPFGIVLVPTLIYQTFLQKDLSLKRFMIFVVTSTIPIALYLLINYVTFGDVFAFAELLKENWQKSLAFPWDGIIASWKRGIFTPELNNYKFLVGYGEAIASTTAWISIFFGIKHWGIKSSYLFYLFLGTLFFTSTGFILSAPRYLLSIPPFFILLARVVDTNKWLKITWIICSTVLLFYVSYEFAWGHWTF